MAVVVHKIMIAVCRLNVSVVVRNAVQMIVRVIVMLLAMIVYVIQLEVRGGLREQQQARRHFCVTV